MDSGRENQKERERERRERSVRGTYDVHLLAFHGGLTRNWKALENCVGRNNEDEYILRDQISSLILTYLSFL